jgi:ribosome-associated protein
MPMSDDSSPTTERQPDHSGIRLDQFLKLNGVTPTGGQAKRIIQAGEVKVNGEVESRRGRRLRVGDRVEVGGETFFVGGDPGEAS